MNASEPQPTASEPRASEPRPSASEPRTSASEPRASASGLSTLCFLRLLALLLTLPLAAQKVHEICNTCHAEQVADFQKHKHFTKSLSCDICHGPSERHRNSNGAVAPDRVAAPDEIPALCGACHTVENQAYSTSKHAKLVLARSKVKAAHCATCHSNHAPRTIIQTLIQCNRCHSALPAQHPKFAVEATCLTCHDRHTLLAKK